MHTVEIDPEFVTQARVLKSRAADLRSSAEEVHPLISLAYRRRASELELAAWTYEARAGLDLLDSTVVDQPEDDSLVAA